MPISSDLQMVWGKKSWFEVKRDYYGDSTIKLFLLLQLMLQCGKLVRLLIFPKSSLVKNL
jgi:hypothetical protein